MAKVSLENVDIGSIRLNGQLELRLAGLNQHKHCTAVVGQLMAAIKKAGKKKATQ